MLSIPIKENKMMTGISAIASNCQIKQQDTEFPKQPEVQRAK